MLKIWYNFLKSIVVCIKFKILTKLYSNWSNSFW